MNFLSVYIFNPPVLLHLSRLTTTDFTSTLLKLISESVVTKIIHKKILHFANTWKIKQCLMIIQLFYQCYRSQKLKTSWFKLQPNMLHRLLSFSYFRAQKYYYLVRAFGSLNTNGPVTPRIRLKSNCNQNIKILRFYSTILDSPFWILQNCLQICDQQLKKPSYINFHRNLLTRSRTADRQDRSRQSWRPCVILYDLGNSILYF